MGRTGTGILLAALLGAPAAPAAAPDPADTFRRALADSEEREKKLWTDYQERFMAALQALVAPVARNAPGMANDAVEDFEKFRLLYADAATLFAAPGEAALAFASSGDVRALPAVTALAFSTVKQVDDAEEELAGPPNERASGVLDLRPGLTRHGLGRREDLLRRAWARCAGAVPYLGDEGWKRAVALDGTRSWVRRVAVLDALGAARDPAARGFLEERLAEKGSTVRIAALEALSPLGKDATPALLRLLEDPAPPVLFALLAAVRRDLAGDPRWIRPLAAHLPTAAGRPRAEMVATLEALTRQRFGDDADRWTEWIGRNAAAIDGGSFVAAAAPVEAVEKPGVPEQVVFFGVPAASRGVAFVLDASRTLEWPCEVEFFRTKKPFDWAGSRPGTWQLQHPDLRGVLRKELGKAIEKAPRGTHFTLVAIPGHKGGKGTQGSCDVAPRAAADAAAARKAQAFVDGVVGRGSNELFGGLLAAMGAGGLDPEPGAGDFPGARIDTVYAWHRGDPRYGRVLTSEAVLDAFRRLNRFRRVVVHAIRVGDQKQEAEATMKGLAESSGGTCLWVKAPPKE